MSEEIYKLSRPYKILSERTASKDSNEDCVTFATRIHKLKSNVYLTTRMIEKAVASTDTETTV